MLQIVDTSMFIGERNIPNSGSRDVMERLDWFIRKYEPVCLSKILGISLYSEIINNPTAPVSANLINGCLYTDRYGKDAIWVGLKPMIVDYTYYHFMKDDATANTGKGVAISQKDMGFNISPAQKMIDAWNEFIAISRECVFFLNYHVDYPLYTPSYANMTLSWLAPINEFDI
jgi:hypothetical protein